MNSQVEDAQGSCRAGWTVVGASNGYHKPIKIKRNAIPVEHVILIVYLGLVDRREDNHADDVFFPQICM